jgi:hypothetical protein|tara:strand:+ start:66 stop:659 length:594 start_codon:yes stop_codon:yes gene_type:complete
MEQVLLGIVIFNAFFMPSEFQFDTLEVSQIQFKQNKNSELNFRNELKTLQGMGIGSREYSQATSWLRYGHGTFLYGYKSETKDELRKLNHYGGHAGFLGEVHYKRYFGLGILVGGGASYTEFTNSDLTENDRSNYFGLASPYMTLGLPLTKTASVNITTSTYYFSEPAEKIDGTGEGFKTPHHLENKVGLEFVWSWD